MTRRYAFRKVVFPRPDGVRTHPENDDMPVIATSVIPGFGQWELVHLDWRKPQPDALPLGWAEVSVAVDALQARNPE